MWLVFNKSTRDKVCRSGSLRDTAIPGMTSLKDGDLQNSSALAQSPEGDIEVQYHNFE